MVPLGMPSQDDGEAHRIRTVIDRVADVEYTLTDSVSEALEKTHALRSANAARRWA